LPTKPRIPSSNIRIGHQKNNSRTFTKQTELFVVAVPGDFFSVLLTLPSPFSYPYSYPLHFQPFSCATIHWSPSQLLFPYFLIHSLSLSSLPLHTSSTCHHTTSPSYTLITCWLAYCTNYKHPQPCAIPDKSTLQYNSGLTHIWATKPSSPHTSSAAPHFCSPFNATFTNYPCFSL
jgi:hypothetical protein